MKNLLMFLLFTLAFVEVKAQTVKNLKEIKDISYLSPREIQVDSLQKLHLILPEGIKNPPLLLWIGGGAWSFVNRHKELPLCRKLAKNGIAVASIGHRLSKGSFSEKRHEEGIKHPEHIKDVAAAFSWLYKNAKDYGYDNSKIFVGGFSSGAHLAALLGMDERYLKKYGLKTDDISGLLPISGAFDIHHYFDAFAQSENGDTQELAKTHVMDVFGDPSGFKAASPATYIEQLRTPMLVVSDGSVARYTEHFEKLLKASNFASYKFSYFSDFDHGALWKNMSEDDSSAARDLMVEFVQHHSGNKLR
ncbi:alpha/beta hydrolase [Poritiphilus flavus]|uniref:Alpha/beta hydrolase fold domain-containing protein n=1 Tax=Poritiphilus flavus TaxID=2697053 RepID=A0A6L9EEI3_9FLAO|nr:alpha/beta hydrolase [Poritiphilus flavus]NAS13136.1 alpha/beta hydrolase fold domain-containing protein [Poritiphilus flavus]